MFIIFAFKDSNKEQDEHEIAKEYFPVEIVSYFFSQLTITKRYFVTLQSKFKKK